MLRPERMSKVSVTGSKAVMAEVIETIHELRVVHLSDYDGSWQGFDNGDPMEGAEEVSGKLVTVRAIENTLDISPEDVEPAPIAEGWEDRLEEVRSRVNELDDERDGVRERLRLIEERIDRLEPFAELGIDLDLLAGYGAVEVLVAEGDRGRIEDALAGSEDVRAYETFVGGDVIAVVAAPAGDATGVVEDALVGVEIERHEVPDESGAPAELLAELEERKRSLEAELAEVDDAIDSLADEEGEFLRGVEVELTVEVQRAEAPLQFATTERAFVAEGWLPADAYEGFVADLADAVGDRVEIEEIERADYEDHGGHDHGEDDAHVGGESEAETPPEAKAAADGGEAVADEGAADGRKATDGGDGRKATDGGDGRTATDGAAVGTAAGGAVTMDDEPPVVLNNLTPAKPFELMVKMVSQPKYSELDPTLLVFLTYPFAFGFMIGDIGYGILYMLIGYGAWQAFDSDAGRAIGSIAIWAGIFTVAFGYLYDDVFGVHMADLGIALPLAGTLTKGLQTTEWAILWIVLSLVFGLLHLNVGLVMGFINELSHGLKAAVLERGSWILTMNGLFVWIFSLHLVGEKPEFLVGEEAVLNLFLGFEGLPEVVGLVGLAAFGVGIVMVGVGEGVAGVAEVPAWAFGHVLSYLRMVAVLLAKGGMAFVVNVLVFGAFVTDGYTEFALFGPPTGDVSFQGLIWIGLGADSILVAIVALIGAVLVFVLGHILVLLLGITAAGIQMLRLEYVEFFQKFYEGGGEEYEPFGGDRATTAD